MIKQNITIQSSATKTVSGQSSAIDVSSIDEMVVFLNVSAVSGTSPTLDVTIEDSPDGTNWYTHTSFTQATATTKEAKRISNFGKFVRINYTIGGTSPSFTFEVVAVGKLIL